MAPGKEWWKENPLPTVSSREEALDLVIQAILDEWCPIVQRANAIVNVLWKENDGN